MSYRNVVKWGRLRIDWDQQHYIWGIHPRNNVFLWIDLGHLVIEWRKK